MNECNLKRLFTPKLMHDIKLFTEGDGINIENKCSHPFTGFKDCCSLFTTNALCCPYIEPVRDNAGWTRYEYEHDYKAMMTRTRLVHFPLTYQELQKNIDDDLWAKALLFMAEKYDTVPKPELPDPFSDVRYDQLSQNPINADRPPPEAVILAEMNDWKQKAKQANERAANFER